MSINDKRTVVLYRVSSKSQISENDDIPLQKMIVRSYIRDNDITLIIL